MNAGVSITIVAVILSITILSACVVFAVVFYLACQKKARESTNLPTMLKTIPIPMLYSRSLHQLKQNNYDTRVYSDSEDSGAILNLWNGHRNNTEQTYHSMDDLSDYEYPRIRSDSLVSSSTSADDARLLSSHEGTDTNGNEHLNTPSSSTSNSPIMANRDQCVLNLSLKYHFHQGLLTVLVINTSSPPKQSNFSAKGLFIVVQLFKTTPQNDQWEDIRPVYKTDIKSFSTNVLFNEEFKYEDIQHNELDAISIKLSLCSHDRFSRVQTLGYFIIALHEVTFDPVKALILQRQIQKDIPAVVLEEKDKGELLLSLRCGSGRINVIVLKALNLKKPKMFMSNDPYITVKLLHKDEVISKKKTSIKKGTYPIWNEPFVFDLVDTDVDSYQLLFAVKSRDLFSSSTKLGDVCIGPQASLTGKNHWKESVCSKNNTMRQVTMSHKLL